jgi:hypothetical protein
VLEHYNLWPIQLKKNIKLSFCQGEVLGNCKLSDHFGLGGWTNRLAEQLC